MRKFLSMSLSSAVFSIALISGPLASADEVSDAVTNKVVNDHSQTVEAGRFSPPQAAREAAAPESAKKSGVNSGAPAGAAMRPHPAPVTVHPKKDRVGGKK